jgi:hypothetical protein
MTTVVIYIIIVHVLIFVVIVFVLHNKVYATINFCSGVLEFLVLPSTLKYIQDRKETWYGMPLVIMIFAVLIMLIPSSLNGTSLNLQIVSIAFVTMKIFEYSIRGIMTEMVRLFITFVCCSSCVRTWNDILRFVIAKLFDG